MSFEMQLELPLYSAVISSRRFWKEAYSGLNREHRDAMRFLRRNKYHSVLVQYPYKEVVWRREPKSKTGVSKRTYRKRC